MEGEVALELRMRDGEMPVLVGIGGMDGFHAGVEPKDEVVEVEAKAEAIRDGNLPPELVEAELAAGLVVIVANSPDVAGIDEEGTIEFPEEEGTILHAEIELDVSTLVQEVDLSVCSLVGTWTERTHCPSTHGVRTSREVSFFEWQLIGIAVRICQTECCMDCH